MAGNVNAAEKLKEQVLEKLQVRLDQAENKLLDQEATITDLELIGKTSCS